MASFAGHMTYFTHLSICIAENNIAEAVIVRVMNFSRKDDHCHHIVTGRIEMTE
jgi:hypothetical protein